MLTFCSILLWFVSSSAEHASVIVENFTISYIIQNKDTEEFNKPHIIVFLADDLGWNDVSFHGSNQIPTPNIDAIAYHGIILNNHYVFPSCTASRSAFLTGKYPMRMGTQHSDILEGEPRGLNLTEKLLPEYLKEVGYKTHAIGKWQLGFFKREYTPTYRGFDTHYGFWTGHQDYHSHITEATKQNWTGFDMRRNMNVDWNSVGRESTDLFTEEAVRLIEKHDKIHPMFLYLSYQTPHSGNKNVTSRTPIRNVDKFHHINNVNRRNYAAKVWNLDESIGNIMEALQRRDMLNNSIILFLSDNGAQTVGSNPNYGSNYPLRGVKGSLWEGSVRGVAALWSPLMRKTNRISKQLTSIIDWLPTLCSAAGMDLQNIRNVDGIDLWSYLTHEDKVFRSQILINMDDKQNCSSIRYNDYKLVVGTMDENADWYGETGRHHEMEKEGVSPIYSAEAVLKSKAGVAISSVINACRRALQQEGKDIANSGEYGLRTLTTTEVLMIRNKAETKCDLRYKKKTNCNATEAPCLYNIHKDPCEITNVANTERVIVNVLISALSEYRSKLVPSKNVDEDPMANPAKWNNTWVNWQSKDPLIVVTETFFKDTSHFSILTVIIPVAAIALVIIFSAIFVVFKKYSKYDVQKENTRAGVPSDNPTN